VRVLLLLLALSPLPVLAETFQLDHTITEVTVYEESARIIRRAPFELPAGSHNLMIQGLAIDDPSDFFGLDVTVNGVKKGAVSYFMDRFVGHQKAKAPDLLAADARVSDLQTRINAVRDEADKARLAAEAAKARIAFLVGLGQSDAAGAADLDRLEALSGLVENQVLAAEGRALEARIRARDIEFDLKDLEADLEHAKKALADLAERYSETGGISVRVDAAEPNKGEVVISQWVQYASGWQPTYRVNLDADGGVQLERSAIVFQETGEDWNDIQLILSTLRPMGKTAPGRPYARLRRIKKPEPVLAEAGALHEPVVESPVIMEESASFSAQLTELGVTYVFPNPVTIASSHTAVQLEQDNLTLEADIRAVAVPQRDDTAFRVIDLKNTSGEEILGSDMAVLAYEGEDLGVSSMPFITSGDSQELGFGRIAGLVIKETWLETGESSGRLMSRSNEQVQKRRIDIRNLTTRAWDVRVLSGVPYSQQEDLEITWTAAPAPGEIDVDDSRGVLGWDLSLEPGEENAILVETRMTWPEEMELH